MITGVKKAQSEGRLHVEQDVVFAQMSVDSAAYIGACVANGMYRLVSERQEGAGIDSKIFDHVFKVTVDRFEKEAFARWPEFAQHMRETATEKG